MKIINTSRQKILADRAVVADSFCSRMVGLLDRKTLSLGEALVITRCQSIHMFFMKFAIDVIFVDKTNRVVGLSKNIKPFQMSWFYLKASFAIELPAGVIDQTNTDCGDRLELI